MARAIGITCDMCRKFETTNKDNALPDGWIVITVPTPNDQQAGRIEVCGNKCLKDMGAARYKAERELAGFGTITDSDRNLSDEGRAVLRQNGLALQHGKGNHANDPVTDCALCVAETAPT